jgi:hypothetical protein
MILRPLCISDDLETAIAYAHKNYPGIAAGPRPQVVNRACMGARDSFLVRFLLGPEAVYDIVQILLIDRTRYFTASGGMIVGGEATETLVRAKLPQTITITLDVWLTTDGSTPSAVEDTPFTATTDHHFAPNIIEIHGTGTLSATASSGLPVSLYAVDPSVATISGFNIEIIGYGNAQFYLEQAGDATYLPAPRLTGGLHILKEFQNETFTGSGGMVVGGQATVSYAFTGSGGMVVGGEGIGGKTITFTGSGGMVVGGQSTAGYEFTGSGGMVVGGQAFPSTENPIKPLAMQNIAITFPYKDTDAEYITLHFVGTGTAKRGGVLTYTILVEDDVNYTYVPAIHTNGNPVYRMYKKDHYWLGLDTFEYIVTETADGLAIDSDIATVIVNAAAPAAMVPTVSGATVTWTGGAYDFTITTLGTFVNVTPSVSSIATGGAKSFTAVKGVGASTTDGYFKVTDHYGNYFFVLMSQTGVPQAEIQTLVCSFTVGTTSLAIGATTPISNITLDPRVSNGWVMFSSNVNVARVENNTLVRGMGNGTCQIILKQFGIAGQYLDGRHEKTFTIGTTNASIFGIWAGTLGPPHFVNTPVRIAIGSNNSLTIYYYWVTGYGYGTSPYTYNAATRGLTYNDGSITFAAGLTQGTCYSYYGTFAITKIQE